MNFNAGTEWKAEEISLATQKFHQDMKNGHDANVFAVVQSSNQRERDFFRSIHSILMHASKPK